MVPPVPGIFPGDLRLDQFSQLGSLFPGPGSSCSERAAVGDAIFGWGLVNVIHDVLNRKKRTDHLYHSGQNVPSLGTPHSIFLSGMSQSSSKETHTPRSPKRISRFPSRFKSLAARFDRSFSLSLIPRRLVLIIVTCFSVVFASTASGDEAEKTSKAGCIELKSIDVENKEFIEKGIKYRDLKNAIVQQSFIDAVQQVLGTEVRSHSGMALSSVDGADSERFNELVAQRARGMVDSYEVTTEEIIGTGDTKLLAVGLRVVVCVPDETTTFDMVAVGDFILSNGSNSERLRSILIDLFPDNLSDYRLIPEHPRHAYHDVKIDGKVLRVDKTDESHIMAEQKKSQEQAAAQIAGGLIGALTGLRGLGSVAASMNAGPAMRTYQVTVEVEVTASRIMDQQVVSDRSVLTKAKLPEDTDFSAVRDELLAAAVEQATQSIYQKEFGVAGGSASTKRESSSFFFSKLGGEGGLFKDTEFKALKLEDFEDRMNER